jgi:hypothetical protein
MALASSDDKPVSRLLKNALVADLVMEATSQECDYLLTEPQNDDREWTNNLGRQLEMDTHGKMWEVGGVHATLSFLVRMIDTDLMSPWRPPHELVLCQELAHEATKHLGGFEMYATLLAGPTRWRRAGKIRAGCPVENLPIQLQPILKNALGSQLHGVLGNWQRWDIRKLRERRQAAIDAAAQTRAAAEAEAARERAPQGPPRPGDFRRPGDGYRPPASRPFR